MTLAIKTQGLALEPAPTTLAANPTETCFARSRGFGKLCRWHCVPYFCLNLTNKVLLTPACSCFFGPGHFGCATPQRWPSLFHLACKAETIRSFWHQSIQIDSVHSVFEGQKWNPGQVWPDPKTGDLHTNSHKLVQVDFGKSWSHSVTHKASEADEAANAAKVKDP